MLRNERERDCRDLMSDCHRRFLCLFVVHNLQISLLFVCLFFVSFFSFFLYLVTVCLFAGCCCTLLLCAVMHQFCILSNATKKTRKLCLSHITVHFRETLLLVNICVCDVTHNDCQFKSTPLL